jgi:integrase
MLAAIPKAFKVKGEKQAERLTATVQPALKFYLEGLWWSRLRLEESLNLSWDREDRIQVDVTGDDPVFIIPKGMQRNKKATICPMAPEFAKLLQRVPRAERTGPVIRLPGLKLNRDCRKPQWVGTTIRRIGKAANVVVQRSAAGKVKFASAHDLRRSFGERWAHRILPKELMEVMRHRSIETTMRYYVGRNAKKTGSAMRMAYNRTKVSIQVSAADSELTTARMKKAASRYDVAAYSVGPTGFEPATF